MTLSIFIVVGLLSALLSKWGYVRASRLLIGLLLIVFLTIGYGLLPYWLGSRLQSGYPTDYHGEWGERSVIVLLGGGTTQLAARADVEPNLVGYARITRAYTQYTSCKQQGGLCVLLVTGGDPQHHRAPEAAIYGTLLRRMGVPVADLITEENSRNTWENAKFSQPLIQSVRPSTVVLLTSGTHMYRSLLYFAHFGIHATPIRADYIMPEFHVLPVSSNFIVMDIILHEYAGIARYHVYQVLALN